MNREKDQIIIDHLDHVAIRVKDMDASAKWYKEVLGLKRYQLPEWGEYPIFLLAGKTGIALFPANANDPKFDPDSNNVKIDHFAFHVSNEQFEVAKQRYTRMGLSFTVKDHHYFDSIYTRDPDGHVVELTTLKMDPKKFYSKP